MLEGYWICYNWIRPNQALNGATPAEAAKVGFGRGEHAWLTLMLKAAVHRYMMRRALP